MMKKLLLCFTMMAAITLFYPQTFCHAEDIWVEHWNEEGCDIYVMDDTIIQGPNDENISFKVAVKQIKDGKLANVVICNFVRWPDEPWRFRTSESEDIDFPPVVANDPVFGYCMQQLGWEYYLENGLSF
ncbi:hypothetical protein [Anaerovibrio sp. JC8]|uniref:hypothetical protein n=1 Tax=Anaerovibrio sp. JC8 TaxID=1240085 RepID=UPI0011784528|nr:hypothetical protein [Anaerovibrio sp. JC8]